MDLAPQSSILWHHPKYDCLAQWLERFFDLEKVVGSNPTTFTKHSGE